MSLANKDMVRLIALKLNNEATSEEAEALDCWLAQHETHRQYFESLRHIWTHRETTPSFSAQNAFQKLQQKLVK